MTASANLKQALIDSIPNLRAFAKSLCGSHDRADDLVQETLVKAWNKIDSFKEGTNLKAWLFTILRNTYFSEFRKAKREVADTDGEYSARVAVHPSQQSHVDVQDLIAALHQLGQEQREALILVAAEGFSYEEAAVICDCAVGTIKSRVNRARHRLSELMDVENGDEFGPDSLGDAVALAGAAVGQR